MMQRKTGYDLLDYYLKEVAKEIFIMPLDSENDDCDFQVSTHPDPWGAPAQLTVELEKKPDRMVVELAVWNGVEEDGSTPIRNEHFVDREQDLFLILLENDEEFKKILSAIALVDSEKVRYVSPLQMMKMDDAVLKFGSGFKEYIESVGTPIPV